jgi:hypothetical protein
MLVWLDLLYYGPQWWPLKKPCELIPGPVDRWIPFLPETAWIYQSLFLLLPVAALIQPTKLEFVRFAVGFCALVAFFSAIFWLYPTELRAPFSILPTSWGYDHLVAGLDGRRNAFPSLHAALTVYAGMSIVGLYRRSALVCGATILWMLMLLISTLTTKQHIFPDLLAGVSAGFTACALVMQYRTTNRLEAA